MSVLDIGDSCDFNDIHATNYDDLMCCQQTFSNFLPDNNVSCLIEAHLLNWYSMTADDFYQLGFIPQNITEVCGYFWFQFDGDGVIVSVKSCDHPPQGFMCVCFSIKIPVFHNMCSQYESERFTMSLQLATDNFYQDVYIWKRFKLTVEQYMVELIDYLLLAQDKIMEGTRHTFEVNVKHRTESVNVPNTEFCSDNEHIKDIYFPDKQYGHITLQTTQPPFIGPDKNSVNISSITDLVEVADIILQTGLPNYKCARIAIRSSLNTVAWEKYISAYPDKRLLDYLRFGFPLGLSDASRQCLNNATVVNHHSALQQEQAVSEFLEYEIACGAIMGPLNQIPHATFHCSPLLTRPKDNGKYRVVVDLSFPKANALNDYVSREAYDGIAYKLKFPSTDHICGAINSFSDPYISKIDISRAFRHLRMDPADALKLGIY